MIIALDLDYLIISDSIKDEVKALIKSVNDFNKKKINLIGGKNKTSEEKTNQWILRADSFNKKTKVIKRDAVISNSTQIYQSEKHNNVAFSVIKKKAKRRIFFGMVWFFGGLIFTLIGFLGSKPGGTFYIFSGAMVFGIILMIKGSVDNSKANKMIH